MVGPIILPRRGEGSGHITQMGGGRGRTTLPRWWVGPHYPDRGKGRTTLPRWGKGRTTLPRWGKGRTTLPRWWVGPHYPDRGKGRTTLPRWWVGPHYPDAGRVGPHYPDGGRVGPHYPDGGRVGPHYPDGGEGSGHTTQMGRGGRTTLPRWGWEGAGLSVRASSPSTLPPPCSHSQRAASTPRERTLGCEGTPYPHLHPLQPQPASR